MTKKGMANTKIKPNQRSKIAININMIPQNSKAGVSGKSVMDHPETRRMLFDVQRGHISSLIFSKIARLARNTKELLEFSDFFQEHGTDLVSIFENIDTCSPAGKLFYTIISAMAEWEREEIASRVKASVLQRAKAGKHMGGPPPYGYIWKDDELVINEEEAKVRRLVFELFVESKRKKSIARTLNERGYRTRTGKKFSDTTIKRWIADPIAKGLRRVNYSAPFDMKGKGLKPQEEWFIHPCPPLVSEELYDKAKAILDEQEKGKQPLNRVTKIFTGYAFCSCGERMIMRNNRNYTCQRQGCGNKIYKDDLEEVFKSELMTFLASEDKLKSYFEQGMGNIKEKEGLLESQKKAEQEVEEELAKLLELHTQGQIPTEAFSEYHRKPYERLNGIRSSIAGLEGEIAALKNQTEIGEYFAQEARHIYMIFLKNSIIPRREKS